MTLEFASRLGLQRFALVETDYFGGRGSQFATAYDGHKRIMDVTEGGVNLALRKVGVGRAENRDESNMINLGSYRNFSKYFEKYGD